MATVIRSSLPAPFPMSEMAGVTSPMIMSGIRNWRKLLKMLLKVTKSRTTGFGKNKPKTMPSTIAMMILGSSPR